MQIHIYEHKIENTFMKKYSYISIQLVILVSMLFSVIIETMSNFKVRKCRGRMFVFCVTRRERWICAENEGVPHMCNHLWLIFKIVSNSEVAECGRRIEISSVTRRELWRCRYFLIRGVTIIISLNDKFVSNWSFQSLSNSEVKSDIEIWRFSVW